MPAPHNAELLKILQDLEPTDDAAVNQVNHDVLQKLVGVRDDNGFRHQVRVESAALKLGIEPALMVRTPRARGGPAAWPMFPVDFIVNDDTSGGAADNSIAQLKLLTQQKFERFAALAVEQAKIVTLTDSVADLAKADEIANFVLDPADLTPFFTRLGIVGASVLTEPDCKLIQKNAAKKSKELKALALRVTKINAATEAGKDVATLLTEADASVVATTNFAKVAKLAVTDQEDLVSAAETEMERAKVGFFSLNHQQETERYEQKQKDLAIANRLLNDIKIAYLAAEANATFAVEQAKIAHDNATDAADKLGKAIAEPDPVAAIKWAEEAQAAYLKVSSAVSFVKDAQRDADNEHHIALDPTNDALKRRRANLLMERNGSLGFTDDIVRTGGANTKAVKSAGVGGVILGTGNAEFDPIRLGSGDTIHSTQLGEGGGEIRLVQDWLGTVSDRSDHKGGKLTGRDKSIAAVKQAKMMLLNYKPEQGPIYIRGGDPIQASRVFAALLLLSQNNPALQLPSTAIISCVDGCNAPGSFEFQSSYIKARLIGLNSDEGEAERTDLIKHGKGFKDKYQGVIEVTDLSETPESVRTGIKPK